MVKRDTQAVEVLKLLGDEAANAVLDHLPEEIATRVREKLAGGTELKLKQQRTALKDFEAFFAFAQNAVQTELNAYTESGHDVDESDEHAPDAAEPYSRNFRPISEAMADLESLSVHQLAGALETEQPRTVAILLNSLNPQLSANVLSFLKQEQCELVVRQLSREQNAPQVLVDRIARATMQRGKTLPEEAPDRRDHIERLAEVIREVPKSNRREMLVAIEEEDPDTSAALRKQLYRFEDLVTLDPQVIQQILGEVDATTLTTAMFGADESINEAILGNLSRRARQTIEEELQFQSRVPESRVKAARESVAELIGKLEQENE